MTTQFLTDDRGQKVTVVIPIAEYETLMEDVADIAVVSERRDDERISLSELKEQLIADGLLSRFRFPLQSPPEKANPYQTER